MYAEVLQICILAVLIFISEGIPQDYVESATPGNGPPDAAPVIVPLAAYAPPDDGAGGYDDTGPYYEQSDASPDNAYGPNGQDYNPAGELDDDPPIYHPDSQNGYDYDPAGEKGDAPPDYAYDPNGQDYGPDGHYGEGGYDDAGPGANYEDAGAYGDAGYEGYQDDYPIHYNRDYDEYQHGEPILQLKLPGSIEMLDRTKPEPGFDLSNDEMKKLKLWPDAVIPYYIDVYSFNDKVMRDKIRSFLSSVNSLTALNFVELPSPPTDDMRWVFFINRRGLLGCADHSIRNFTNTGVQQVVLGYHCMNSEGELAEAVLAIAGVPPQHNAPDRDYYIRINEQNIIPEKKYLFERRTDDEWLFHDLEYDFNSAGHFHRYKHSINGRATISPQKESGDVTLGESKTLTASDIVKIRMLYNYIVKKKLLQAPDCHKLFEPGKKFGQYRPSAVDLKPRPKPYRFTGEAPDAPLVEDDVEVIEQNEDGNDGEFTVAVSDETINNGGVNDPDYNQIPDANEVIDDFNTPGDYNTPDENENMPDENEVINFYDAPIENEYVDYGDVNTDKPTSDYNYNYQNLGQGNNDLPQGEEENEFDDYDPYDSNGNKKPSIISLGKGPVGSKLTLTGSTPVITTHVPLNPDPMLHPMLSLKSPMKKTTKTADLLADLSDFRTDEDDIWSKIGKKKLK